MKKRVLILSTSPRQGGNSDALAASFAEGARSAGHTVSHCSLRDKSLHFCLGCLSEVAPQAVDGALHGLEGWLACFPKATLQGVVCGCGVTGAGEIQDSPALSQARAMGAAL